jgi:hypothetical protein
VQFGNTAHATPGINAPRTRRTLTVVTDAERVIDILRGDELRALLSPEST